MDDLVVLLRTDDEGLSHLQDILLTAGEYGLDVNWKKCRFLERKIEYLGHLIENGSVKPSERKITAVKNFPKSTNVRDLQRFLGLAGYFRKFVPRYSMIARPLSNLLKKDVTFYFGEKQNCAFHELKDILSRDPVLRLYRIEADTELHTDASKLGFGAILMQRDPDDQRFHLVYYASWKTTDVEARYSSYELEVLAIIKSLRKFRVYLLGIPFKIITDCRAFSVTMNKRDLCMRMARWSLLLEEFNYDIEHRSDKLMNHVDTLSRHPRQVMLVEESRTELITRIYKAQREDDDIKSILVNVTKRASEDFVLQNGILYCKSNDDLLLVIPKSMQHDVIK